MHGADALDRGDWSVSQDFIQSEGYRVKRKGLSYKDVRRPFIVFKGWGGIATYKIFEFFYSICLFYSKEICIFALVNCVNHKLLP